MSSYCLTGNIYYKAFSLLGKVEEILPCRLQKGVDFLKCAICEDEAVLAYEVEGVAYLLCLECYEEVTGDNKC